MPTPTPGAGPNAWHIAWIACLAQSPAGTVTQDEKSYLTHLRKQTTDRAILAAIDRALAL